MPHVVNGIGTWYWGKSGIHGIKGVCEACGRSGELLSYDTRTYFVIFFVPVLPLGRKRILEQCPSCKRHRAVKHKDWQSMKNVTLPDAVDAFRSSPNDRDKAIDALQISIACQDAQAVDDVAAIAASGFANDAEMQVLIGESHAYFSKYESAETAFRASLAAKENDDVRNALARNLLYQSRPDEAWDLIAHDLKVSPDMRGGLALLIAESYQTWGMHDAAQTVLDETIAALPQLEIDADYKRLRKSATKYQGTDKKLKPKLLAPPKSLKAQGRKNGGLVPMAIAAIVVLGGFALFAYSSLKAASHREVHFVNGLSIPYRVSIDGVPRKLPAMSQIAVEVAEGDISVSVKDADVAIPEQEFHLSSTFFGRLFDDDIHVVNPDRAAVILWEKIEYTERGDEDADYVYKLHNGEFHQVFTDVDFPFKEFPDTVRLPSGSAVHKTRVELVNKWTPPSIAVMLMGEVSAEAASTYLNQKASHEPDDTATLAAAMNLLPDEQSGALLKKLKEIRPIRIEAHRNYQTFMERVHPEVDLVAEYRDLLAESPDDSVRVYLYGRVTHDNDEARRLFQKAASSKPPCPHAFGALGYEQLMIGEFGRATDHYEKALALAPENQSLMYYHMLSLSASERFEEALKVHARLDHWLITAQHDDIYFTCRLGDSAKFDAHIKKLLSQSSYRDDPVSANWLRANAVYIAAYVGGDVASAIEASRTIEEPKMDFERAVMQGDLQAAAGMLVASSGMETRFAILLGLMLRDAGDVETAERVETLAIDQLKKQGLEPRMAADWLSGMVTPKPDDVLELKMMPTGKAVVLVAMARKQPEHRERYLELANELNFDRRFPYLTLQKLIDSEMSATNEAQGE